MPETQPTVKLPSQRVTTVYNTQDNAHPPPAATGKVANAERQRYLKHVHYIDKNPQLHYEQRYSRSILCNEYE